MEKSIEENLYTAVIAEDQDAVSRLVLQGANPNKTTSHGKSCLGEAAFLGHLSIVKILIDASKSNNSIAKTSCSSRKRHLKSYKRKLKPDAHSEETAMKYKNISERNYEDKASCETVGSSVQEMKPDKNQGYFVFIHSEGSSSDEGKKPSIRSPLSPSSLTPSPQAELEWDEEIGNVAPTTSEDETWSSMYRWYAAILESTGAAIASASMLAGDIDQQDAFMKTALHYAALQGHAGVVKLLLDAGCKVNTIAGDGLTALHVAVIRNNTEIVKMLIDAGSQVNYKTHEKMTPLHFAASRGYLDMIKILVNNGAYLEARDSNERTPLYLAAGRGHVEVVRYLINAGTNVNGEEIHGYTPLSEAVWQRYPQVVEVLLASGARITHSHKLLRNAIIQRQVEIVEMLTSVGGGIHLHNDNGDSPLLLATRLAQPAIARILLEKGANVNSRNIITGENTLHYAVESIENPDDFEKLLICLIEHSIDMNATALTRDTALNRAILLQKDNAAVLLIRYGADVNASDLQSYGLDNLSIASRRRSIHLASILLKAGHAVPLPESNTKIPKPGCAANWLHYASKQPLTLSDLCRIKIRNSCKHTILFHAIESLYLPKSLKQFLMLENEGF